MSLEDEVSFPDVGIGIRKFYLWIEINIYPIGSMYVFNI